MKKALFLLCALLTFSGCEDTNVAVLTDAASDAVSAVTLTDAEVQALASQAVQSTDSKHRVASSDSFYASRLQRLVNEYYQWDDHQFNFKVYITESVNAFAMADGSIRINSALMDLMTDAELLFVIGHEMGHVVKKHTRKKVVMAYATSALRKGVASQQNEVGMIAESIVGAFAQQLTHAQFSQHEERQADLYGLMFLKVEGYEIEVAISTMKKLATNSSAHGLLSSHPHPEDRIARLISVENNAQEEQVADSLLARIFTLIKTLVMAAIQLLLALVSWLLSLL